MLDTIFSIFLDALKDSIVIFPALFICYVLIELLEEKILEKYQTNKFLKGKFAPVVSAGFGLIPQCGFSVVAADLYSKRAITIGSLFAILLATSDEALPLMIANPACYLDLLLILSIKFVYAVFVGLFIDFIFRKKNQREKALEQEKVLSELKSDDLHGCCKHELEKKHNKVKEILWHPFVHSLKIFAFILVVNIVFGAVVEFVGEDAISAFMTSTGFFQPFLVSLVGVIPNCAASVIITEMFMLGKITLGSCIAGLCMNSGLAIVMLFKMNKKVKENLLILVSMFFISCFIGIIVNLF